MEITFLPTIHQKYIYMWNNSYRTPTERWQKTSDFPKGKKLPTYLGRAKEKRKNRDKRIGTGPAPLGRRKSFHTLGSSFTGGDGWRRGEALEPRRRAQQQGCRGQSGEIPAQPEGLVCSPAGMGRGWELRLRLRSSDPRERTGVDCVNTA